MSGKQHTEANITFYYNALNDEKDVLLIIDQH